MLNSTCVKAGKCVLKTSMTKMNKICRPNVLKSQYIFMFFLFLNIYLLGLKEAGILLSARIKICIFEPFPTFRKVGVDQKNIIKYELLLKAQNCILYMY